jgi:phosphate uptake regulator
MMTGTEVELRMSELHAVVLAVGEQAHATLGRAVEALVRRDTAAASAVIAGDDVIEGQCAAVRRQGGGDDERALLRVAHHLARISEHVLAMCERVIAIGRDEYAEAIADGDGRAVVEPPVVMPC